MNTAGNVRLAKERNPSSYCADRKCLWRIRDREGNATPCPKHPVAKVAIAPVPYTEVRLAAETKPSITDRIARFRCTRVMSHVVERMKSLHEVWTAIDVEAGPGVRAEHTVGVRNGEAFCWIHADGECDAPIAVQHARMNEVLGEPAE